MTEFKVGDRVRLSAKAGPEPFGASPEEWENNPKTGTVIKPNENVWPGKVLVEFDVEWEYNLKDLICWLQPYEIMHPDDIEHIREDKS